MRSQPGPSDEPASSRAEGESHSGSAGSSHPDPLRWILDRGHEAAAITLGMTILNVNRLQVYRRDLAKAFDKRARSATDSETR